MPALTAKFTADASQMSKELDRAGKMAVVQCKAIEASIRHSFPQKAFNASNTLFNPTEAKTAAQQYGGWWQETLKKNDLATIGWIRRLREARAEAAAAKAMQYAATTDMIRAAAIGGVGGVGGREHGRTGIAGIMSETLVVIREIGRGSFSKIPGSMSILAQRTGLLGKVFKSTAAAALEYAEAENKLLISLAQTAVATEVAMGKDAAATVVAREAAVAQQAKALAAKEAAEMQLATASVTVTSLGIIIGALLAVGAAAFFVWEHFKKLNEAMDKTSEEMAKPMGHILKSKAEAMKEAGKAAGELAEHLRELSDVHRTLTEETDLALEAMREEFTLMRELARLKGEKKGDERKAEQEMRKREMGEIEKNLDRARKNREQAEQKEKDATAKAFTSEDAVRRKTNQKELNDELTKAQESVKKYSGIKNEFQSDVDEEIRAARRRLHGMVGKDGVTLLTEKEKAERLEVEKKEIYEKPRRTKGGEEISYGSAAGLLDQHQMEVANVGKNAQRFAETQSALEKAREAAKAGSAKAVEDVQNLEKKRDQLARQIALHDKFDPQLNAADKGKKGGQGFSITEHQRLGAYIGGPQMALLSEAKVHTHALKAIVHNTARIGGGGGNGHQPRRGF